MGPLSQRIGPLPFLGLQWPNPAEQQPQVPSPDLRCTSTSAEWGITWGSHALKCEMCVLKSPIGEFLWHVFHAAEQRNPMGNSQGSSSVDPGHFLFLQCEICAPRITYLGLLKNVDSPGVQGLCHIQTHIYCDKAAQTINSNHCANIWGYFRQGCLFICVLCHYKSFSDVTRATYLCSLILSVSV